MIRPKKRIVGGNKDALQTDVAAILNDISALLSSSPLELEAALAAIVASRHPWEDTDARRLLTHSVARFVAAVNVIYGRLARHDILLEDEPLPDAIGDVRYPDPDSIQRRRRSRPCRI